MIEPDKVLFLDAKFSTSTPDAGDMVLAGIQRVTNPSRDFIHHAQRFIQGPSDGVMKPDMIALHGKLTFDGLFYTPEEFFGHLKAQKDCVITSFVKPDLLRASIRFPEDMFLVWLPDFISKHKHIETDTWRDSGYSGPPLNHPQYKDIVYYDIVPRGCWRELSQSRPQASLKNGAGSVWCLLMEHGLDEYITKQIEDKEKNPS